MYKYSVKAKSEKDNYVYETIVASTFTEVEGKYLEKHPNHCIIEIELTGIIIDEHTFDVKY